MSGGTVATANEPRLPWDELPGYTAAFRGLARGDSGLEGYLAPIRGLEAAVAARRAAATGETLWYRMVAGGPSPRYVCLRPRASLQALLDGTREAPFPEAVTGSIVRMTVEILNFRPTMSYGVGTK